MAPVLGECRKQLVALKTFIVIIIMQLRKDISSLERVVTGQITRAKISEQLERKCHIRHKGYQIVLDELKQRATAQAATLRRYEGRTKQYRQNRLLGPVM